MILKKSCTVAALMASWNWSLFRICPSATIVLVTLVPILAPMIMGTAPFNDNVSEATSVTMMAVVVELLCISAVANKPIKSATRGSLVMLKACSTRSEPISLKPLLIRSSESRKIKRVNNTSQMRGSKVSILFNMSRY